jgi:hypothetical protein
MRRLISSAISELGVRNSQSPTTVFRATFFQLTSHHGDH